MNQEFWIPQSLFVWLLFLLAWRNRNRNKATQRKAIIREAQIPELLELHGLDDFKIPNKRQILRNTVLPEIGRHIFDCAFSLKQKKIS